MKDALSEFLKSIGEDPDREGLKKTPKRWEEALKFLTSGYDQNLDDVVNDAFFPLETDGIVVVKDIEFYSLCEHHLLPFTGKAHIGYVPNDDFIGLSKMPRIVDMFARRLQTQEHLGRQICETLEKVLKPKAVGILIEARHFCMMMRGVQKQHSIVLTQHLRGAFKTDEELRQEFLNLIQRTGG
jgi:GTP cyclohydrolase I